jgi:hypothetical protein
MAIDNLAAFGVEEMDTDTADQVGGLGPLSDLVTAVFADMILEVLNDPGAIGSAFAKGFNLAAS